MSSSGIQSISSGPLIIRTYNDSTSSDVTYLLKDYDYPVSSNYVLITSTNGQLVPSDNIYISSITISSINGLPYAPSDDVFWSGNLAGDITNDNTGSVHINTSLQCSTITDVSTINGLPYPPQDDVFWASTLNGDIVNTNTGIVNISTGLIVNNSFSTLTIFDNIGLPGTTGQVLTAGPSGAQVIWSNTLNVLSISTTSISTSTINGLPYPPQNDTFWSTTLNGDIVNTNTGNVYISTALTVNDYILTNKSYLLYNVANPYATLSITQSTSAGFGYINCDYLTFRTSNNGGALLSLNTTASMMNVDGTLSTLSIRDNTGSSGTSGQVLTAGPSGAQVIWSNTLNVLSISTTSISASSLNATGDIYATGNITAGSDIRFKTAINTLENSLSTVKNLRGVSYTTIDTQRKNIGVIAQEIEQFLPEVVLTDTTENHFKSVAYGNIVGILIEAIKELSGKVDNLEKLIRTT